MNAIQLTRSDNGRDMPLWVCEKCNQWSQSKGCADLCCAPCETCGKPAERGSMGQCSDCRWREFNARERAKLEKLAAEAKRDPDWSGWVYSDDYHGGNDGYFESVEEFVERVEDDFARDPMTPRPAYVWATVARRIVNIGVDDVLGLITEDRPEDFETSDCNGLNELKAALEAFNNANQDLMYEPDRRIIVPIKWKEAK